jgi:radical SAM superfamily enzyme YgiQ (UPF0313 family)
MKKLGDNDVPFGGTFILGLPTETDTDVMRTIQLIMYMRKISKQSTFEMYDYIPHPGTPLFKMAHEYGFPEPQSLGEWADLDFNFKPWMPTNHRRFIKIVKLAASAYSEINSNINAVHKRISRSLNENKH